MRTPEIGTTPRLARALVGPVHPGRLLRRGAHRGRGHRSTSRRPPRRPRQPPMPTLSPSVAPTAQSFFTPAPASYGWWNDRVFYEIFVRSFQDSDGDGNGDLKGLISRLDYLNDGDPETTDDLGVTGIWLMPIQPSPSYHGYDVVDYKAINPDYGTMEDFAQFLDEAHERGIKVIVDLVMNHTSSRHPWFIEAQDPELAQA